MMNAVVKPYHEMCLNSSELIVPRDTYQRALHPARVARIAKEFDERVANEPKISFRDGHYYVMDGQNTIAARKFLNGGEDLQIRCKVYFGMTEREEALLFAQQTGISERLSAGQKLRALIFAGEPAAVAFQQATELAGVHLSFEEGRGKQRISCIATAYHEFIRLGPELYIESLDVLLNAWNGEPDSMSSANLLGICRFVELYHSEYNKGRLIAKLRQVDEIFNGDPAAFSGKRILLGITGDERVSAKASPNGKQTAFCVNRDVWLYDQADEELVNVFSFRTGEDQNSMEYKKHDVRILQVLDNGDIDFLLYGYMNRGRHEGQVGIGLYHYSDEKCALEERFFAPSVTTYEDLKADLETLCYLSGSGMLYLMQDHAVYGIDLNSSEYIVLADSLEEEGYAVSRDGRHFAWQDDQKQHQASYISLMDLETGTKQTISAPEGDSIRSLGFVGGDFLYGLAHQDSRWMVNGRLEEVPMYALEIQGEDGQVLTRYEKAGFYISGVTVEESRIHLERLASLSDTSYTKVDSDTIVCNADLEDTAMEGIGWYASSDKGKIYFVQLSSDVKNKERVNRTSPERVSYDQSLELNLTANTPFTGMTFYAYGNGHLKGTTQDFVKAVEMAYEDMGLVTDQDQNILWNRTNRGTIRTIRDVPNTSSAILSHLEEFTESREFDDGIVVLDAKGLGLNQILYFVDQGLPVVAYTGEGSYVLIIGFDQFNVTLYQPETGENWKMGLNDASAYFQNLQNDFICSIRTDK